MIDIHNHILPMVDDGSSSIEMSLTLIDQAYRHGTTSMILTPHLAYAYGFENPNEKIIELFEQFKEIVRREGIPMSLYLGCEFLYTSKDSFYRHLEDITLLNDTKYLLMEFYFDISKSEILEAIDTVIKEGYIPIIAHPERFEAVQIHYSLPQLMVEKGAMLQMNKGSILGDYGRRAYECVRSMLEDELISFVGSDAHNLNSRDSKMDESYEMCIRFYDEDYIDEIFQINPIKYLNIEEEEDDDDEYRYD